uniref:Uncharacterized protein n=1 Tax=Setaria viridis TaxID=4556 RepID=A0A4U6TAP4_SETVI|nr:hypothetical protein SEVIR_8G015525v2 [Setaria viridis]
MSSRRPLVSRTCPDCLLATLARHGRFAAALLSTASCTTRALNSLLAALCSSSSSPAFLRADRRPRRHHFPHPHLRALPCPATHRRRRTHALHARPPPRPGPAPLPRGPRLPLPVRARSRRASVPGRHGPVGRVAGPVGPPRRPRCAPAGGDGGRGVRGRGEADGRRRCGPGAPGV